MTITEQIREQLKEAMREKNTLKLNTYRGILSAVTNELVAKGKTPQDALSDDEVLVVLRRLAKQRRESSDQYRNAGREDLAVVEDAERQILEVFLPRVLSKEELKSIVEEEMRTTGISEVRQKGQLIGAIMKRTSGNVDQVVLQELLKEMLSE